MSNKASETVAALFSRTLRRGESRAGKSVKQEASLLIEEAKVGRESGDAAPKPSGKLSALGKGGKSVPRAVKDEAESIIAKFDSDVEKMQSAVERARNKSITPDLTDREKKLERFKRIASDSPKSVNKVLRFGLEAHQVTTIDQMLGQLFGQRIKLATGKDLRRAQESANKLIAAMKGHWDDALPKGESRAKVLKSAFDALKAALKKDPSLNPSRFIRKELFDPWRKRFMQRLGADGALVAELRASTGIEIVTEKGIPKFSLELKVGSSKAQFGFDVDHAETRLSDAVKAAKRPDDLLSVIESEGMQLLTPRENRIQIEALRKATREYFENADEATLAYFKRMNTSRAALEKDIDAMIEALDRPGDVFY